MTALAGRGAAGAGPRQADWLRAAVLGPRGEGTTRRRASDAFRFGFAVLAVAVSIPVMRANSDLELSIVHALNRPPAAAGWLFTAAFWAGSAGVIAGLAALAILVPRLKAVRQIVWAGAVTWAVCALLGLGLGPAAGRPVTEAIAGVHASYPLTLVAVTIAVAGMALPYLSRPLHFLVWFFIMAAAIAAVVDGSGLPVNVLSSLAIGWGVAAGLHLALGSPLGLPSVEEVATGISGLQVEIVSMARARDQFWGVERFAGQDTAGGRVEVSVYGRDAADARVLAKLWRFCFYRDSGPTLVLDRLQQVEHEAYLTLMAGRAGVLVPEVVAAGRFGARRDAVLVTRLPAGRALSGAGAEPEPDETIDDILRAVLGLRRAGIAHGALRSGAILLSAEGVCVKDFRCASSSAPAGRLDDDLAAILAALSVRFGAERTAAAAARVLDAEAARGALVHLQRSALDRATVSFLRQHKELLPDLRTAMAGAAGIELPKLAEPKRISWLNLAFGLGMVVGLWAIVGVLADVAASLDVIKGARIGWVALAFALGQLPAAANALAIIGSVTGEIPYGRCLALEVSNTFTSLVGGDVAQFALRVRFFQRQGYDSSAALSSGAIASTASWAAKGLLFLASIGFAAGNFGAPESSGGRQTAIWIVTGAVLAAGVAAALTAVIPRLRQLASARVRPYLVSIWTDLKLVAAEPRKIAYVLVGALMPQLLVAFCLGASLHAVGQHASLATLLVVITSASLVGGAVPVPGGAGVIEAGLIAGLTSAGIPQDQAVAAVFIERLCTAYLPPIWGWFTLAWMRRREYL